MVLGTDALTAGLFLAGQDIQRVKPEIVTRSCLLRRHHINRAATQIDGGSRGNADPGLRISAGERSFACLQQRGLPQLPDRRIVRVERVDAVVLGRDEDHIVGCTVDCQVRYVEWLRVDISIHEIREQASEFTGCYVRGSQDGLVCIQPGACIVSMPCGHTHTGGRRRIAYGNGCRAGYRGSPVGRARCIGRADTGANTLRAVHGDRPDSVVDDHGRRVRRCPCKRRGAA